MGVCKDLCISISNPITGKVDLNVVLTLGWGFGKNVFSAAVVTSRVSWLCLTLTRMHSVCVSVGYVPAPEL